MLAGVHLLRWEASVEVGTRFILHGQGAMPTRKDAVTWMWLPGTGQVATELKRVGQQRVLLPSPDWFLVSPLVSPVL